MSFCKHCVQGVTHEGTPEGKWEKIGGVDCYIGTPAVDYPKDKVVLFLADAFGIQLVNNQLLVDDFARNGFRTIAPDYLNGDPIPADALNNNISALDPSQTFDIKKWFQDGHTKEHTRPTLDKVINALKEEGVSTFAATGYCFGGRYVFDLAFDNAISVSVASHPSILTIPDDLEKYAAVAKAPLLINGCTFDPQFPPEAQEKADQIFGDGKFAPGYKREYWEGCTHGFAVRGDMSDPKVKAGKEGAFKAAVEWLHSKL
ncbi:dienelactone hydrolase endo-1,3,1,4-beta-D-glucanase [Crucibulum laeve]|uniref:Dienelactone hydrolase endo-1,3,1,4-beta-D-glucanase n=1 Tax=Crucibulum laeve TaxID=68775 RepID=A0A5C3M3Q6_9AGAR|nr:dienelactone hydrolase endo-1,3,1,4-beta-D-glucanase [Crucibulum laeve]